MDYYTYQKQFAENLNQIINQQCIVSNPTITNNVPLNYPYTDTNTGYPHYGNVFPPQQPEIYKLPSVPQVETTVDTKTDDELWIETWLSKIGKIQINLNSTIEINPIEKPVKPVKYELQIHTAKAKLKNCFHILDQLQQLQEYLKTNVEKIPTVEWTTKTMEIGVVKDNFLKVIGEFERPEVVSGLCLAIQKRKKKRLAIKRKKQNRKNYISDMLEQRQKLHKGIDRWLESMKEEVERAKIEENMKKDADSVLSEVTKKKSDARKLVSLISSLSKLRHVREQTAVQRGEKISLEDSNAFIKATDRLSKIWSDSLNVSTKEEQGLRMMLEETAVEDCNAARYARERKVTQEWDVALFGPKRMPSPAYWGLMAAEKDLETFIAIRKSWDTFLNKGDGENSSHIPIGWVTPNSNPQENWVKYLDAF